MRVCVCLTSPKELRACGRMFEPERDVRGGGPSSDAQSDTRPSCSGISATGPLYEEGPVVKPIG